MSWTAYCSQAGSFYPAFCLYGKLQRHGRIANGGFSFSAAPWSVSIFSYGFYWAYCTWSVYSKNRTRVFLLCADIFAVETAGQHKISCSRLICVCFFHRSSSALLQQEWLYPGCAHRCCWNWVVLWFICVGEAKKTRDVWEILKPAVLISDAGFCLS